MRHCLVMADKVAKLPSLVNNLINKQGVTLFSYLLFYSPLLFLFSISDLPAELRRLRRQDGAVTRSGRRKDQGKEYHDCKLYSLHVHLPFKG
jgi:hypothetical protein